MQFLQNNELCAFLGQISDTLLQSVKVVLYVRYIVKLQHSNFYFHIIALFVLLFLSICVLSDRPIIWPRVKLMLLRRLVQFSVSEYALWILHGQTV